jgi:hypothetical protein
MDTKNTGLKPIAAVSNSDPRGRVPKFGDNVKELEKKAKQEKKAKKRINYND